MVRSSRTRFIGRVLYAAGASVLSVVAVALASSTGESGASPRASIQVGALSGSVIGGGSGATVLRVGALEPGQSSDGTVTVVNRGDSGGLLTLSAPEVSDAPAPSGGALSKRLQLTVLDLTDSRAAELVYSGGVDSMRARTLGYLRPGQSRSYLVGATFIPGKGPASAMGGDDAYRGGSTNLTLDWGATTSSPPKPPPVATDTQAPKVTIEVPGRQDVLGQGHLNVRVLCGEPCSAEATLVGTQRSENGPPVRAGDRSAAGSADLTLELPAALKESLRKQLAAGTTVVFQAKATARDSAGNEATATRRVGLTPAS